MKFNIHREPLSSQNISYLLAVAIFACLLLLRESTYGYVYDVIPVLGRALPFVVLTLLVMHIYQKSGHTLASIGLCKIHLHRNIWLNVLLFIGTVLLILIVKIFLSSFLSPFLDAIGPSAGNLERMAPLRGNFVLLCVLLPLMWGVVILEEILFRGILINAIAAKFKFTKMGWLLGILFAALLFGLGHFWQGLRGIISVSIGAVIYGVAYFLFKRNLWPVIGAHIVANTMGFISIYMSAE